MLDWMLKEAVVSVIGLEGQIVIERDFLDRLGVEPGWDAVQLLRDGHVEIHFLPPRRAGMSAGVLAGAGKRVPSDAAELKDAIGEAVAQAVAEKLLFPP
jgi:hypothetical protein